MARDYRAEIHRQLERQRAQASSIKDYERAAAQRMQAAVLSVADVANIISSALDDQKKELLGHMGRMITLLETTQYSADKDRRIKNLHMRLTHVESVLRRLQKGTL